MYAAIAAQEQDRRHRLERLLEDVADAPLGGQRLGKVQERPRRLRRLPLGAEQVGVLEGDRRVRGQHLQQALILFVELPVAELRQDDHADDIVAADHRDREHRLEQVLLGAVDRDGERDLARVGGQQRFAGERDGAGDALADPGDEALEVLALVLGEELAAERDRQQQVLRRVHQVHAAVVVVDDRAELRGDRGADLADVAERVQGRGEAVQHVELRHGPGSVRRGPELPVVVRCVSHR